MDLITKKFPKHPRIITLLEAIRRIILPIMKPVADHLVANLQSFAAFARSRLGDPQLAEDVVQESLIKALNAETQPSDHADTVTWFYRILRNSIIDLHRRNATRKTALERFSRELPEAPGAGDKQALCQCFRRLLPAIPTQHRVLLERIDLGGEDADTVANDLDLTLNNLHVRLHRGRRQLRELLARNCKACATHGCLDCDCEG